MALIQAKGRLESAFAGRYFGSATTTANGSSLRANFTGLRNLIVGEGLTDQRTAIPNGHLAPSTWFLPQVAGGMSSINESNFVVSVTGNAAQGLNAVGDSPITFSTSGSADGVAAAVGDSSITFTTSGNATAPLNAVGAATITFTASAELSGITDVTASSIISFTANATTGALGFMNAVPIDVSLTPEAVAEAVWDRLVALHPTEGSAGQVLTSAQKAAKLAAALSA
jgi:hypothetical protein